MIIIQGYMKKESRTADVSHALSVRTSSSFFQGKDGKSETFQSDMTKRLPKSVSNSWEDN